MELDRRAFLGLGCAAAVGTALSAQRLVGVDIPGRGENALTVALNGTAQDAAARAGLIAAFARIHPDIPVKFVPIQAQDWGDFFAKILTMVAAGMPPDVVDVATEGTQLFAARLAHPLDDFVKRDASELTEFFDDVSPALIESFMYQGSLFQMPFNFNAANMYYNTTVADEAGLGRPEDAWTRDTFTTYARAMAKAHPKGFLPYFWTNRLFGGVVPWLYANDTCFLTHEKSPGGEWLWDRFYPGQPTRSGGFRWPAPNALDERVVETFDYLRELVAEGLSSSLAQGGGNELVARFAQGSIGMTPAGGYWAQGLHDGGMGPGAFDVTYFPQWRTQRQSFGAEGYAVMKTSTRKEQAWEWIKFCISTEGIQLAIPKPNTTPARRSLVDAAFYAESGPKNWKIFYDTLDHLDCWPIPAPPQQAGTQNALIKNTPNAITGSAADTRRALSTFQRDLEIAMGTKA